MTGMLGGSTARWHRPGDLSRLNRTLKKLGDHNDNIMTLPELDGFCTGLILCPEMIPSDQWLKEVWGGDGEPDFESVAAFKTLMDLVMDHCDRIATQLSDPPHYCPVLMPYRATEKIVIQDWAKGFARAAQLDPDSWEALIESDDKDVLVAFYALLELSVLGTSQSSLDETEQSELLAGLPALLPKLVLTVNRFKAVPAVKESAIIIPFPGHRTSPRSGGR